jgi:hypothetical protein
MEPDKD